MASVTTLNGFKMIALAYREKYDNVNKEKAKKDKFISYFLTTYCVPTLPVIPEEKKRNYLYGTRYPSKFVNSCKFVEEEYYGMPDSDIVNHNTQFLPGI